MKAIPSREEVIEFQEKRFLVQVFSGKLNSAVKAIEELVVIPIKHNIVFKTNVTTMKEVA